MRRAVLSGVVLLWWQSLAFAQGYPVYDNMNFLQALLQFGEAVATTVNTAKTVENQLTELLPLDGIMAAPGISEDMAALGEIITQGTALSRDLGQLQVQIEALFDIETAPDTRQGLEARIGEIRALVFQCRRYAVQTQTLVATVFRTIDHLTGLIASVSDFVGAKQGMQTLVQVQGTVSKTLAITQVQAAAYQQADVVDRLSRDVIIESLHRIEAKRWEDWPR